MTDQNLNINKCTHVQLGGTAFYDEKKYFMFAPDEPMPGTVARFRGLGMAQQMSDGTFDFVRCARKKTQSQLIKKLAHGRISKTKDGAIQLTLKVFVSEGLNINQTILDEAKTASTALVEHQLKQ